MPDLIGTKCSGCTIRQTSYVKGAVPADYTGALRRMGQTRREAGTQSQRSPTDAR